MQWHALEEDEVLKELKVQPSIGLNRKDVEERLNKYGPNELLTAEGLSTIHIFIEQSEILPPRIDPDNSVIDSNGNM